MIDHRGRLLLAALGFAGLSMPSYDRALWALRSWLDSWPGIGAISASTAAWLRRQPRDADGPRRRRACPPRLLSRGVSLHQGPVPMRLIGLAVTLGLILAPLAAEAQQTAKIHRVGLLLTGTPPDPNVEAFREALREAKLKLPGHHIVAPVLADRPAIGAATCGMFLSGASALLTPVKSILGKRFAAAVQV